MGTYAELAIGPRRVGGTYRCDYWHKTYRVLHIGIGDKSRIPWSDWSITVRWADGTIGTHCTRWDMRDSTV